MYTIVGADGKEYGPITSAHILEWIRDGRVNLKTKARLDRENIWKTLGDFAEFGGQTTAILPAPPLLADPREPDRPVAVDASRWLRLPAAMIDGFLKFLCYLPITVPLVRAALAEALRGEQRTFAEMSQLSTQIVDENLMHALPWFVLLVLVQLCLLTWRSQSVGKLLLGLRIVRVSDQAPAGFVRGFLLRGTLPFMVEQIPFLGLLFWAVDSCFIFREDRRCLHDLLAGTRVVQV